MPAAASPVAHHVFVDFENVHTVDLDLVAGLPVHVTLLVGMKQKRMDFAFVRQIHRHASQVDPIEVGASGHNALDLVLAYHLGRAIARQGDAAFYIVSKDKDFNPLIAHLRTEHLDVSRHEEFAALPFLARAPKRAPSAEPRESAVDERFRKLVDRLTTKTKARPVRRKTLLSHIQAFYANRLSPDELEEVVTTLQTRSLIAIDDAGKVSYP
jgi:hypothetical protein